MEFNLSNSLIMSLVCIGVVFLVLLSIMFMIMILSAVTRTAPQKTAAPAPVVAIPTPSNDATVVSPAASSAEPEVVAAITAVISTMVREPIADIRITRID
ncbi:MAG: OadG family protein [Bacillota bacterium]|nr:OadG family protein [Bacillota bacterium]